jgi:hypothetical protein
LAVCFPALFALTLHPDKTRLIQFGRRAAWKELAGPGRDFFEVFANAPI